MSGTSPFALVNLGKGAEAGIDQYGKDVKDIKAEDRLLKQADRKLSEAQYLQSRGDAEGAQKKIAERDALIQDYKKIEYQGKVSLAAASMSANRPDINMELLNSMRQDAEYYKKDAKGNILKDSKGQPIFDASKAANAIKGYDVKSESNALKALSDQLKTEYDPVKRKAIQDKIDAILIGEGSVPGGTTKTPTKPISSFGG
jgi:flagellar hook-length control protein FliK